MGGSSKRRVLSQYEPVIWPCGSRPLRLPPRSGTRWHARNGELIALAYQCFGWACSVKHGAARDPKLAVIGWYRFGSEMIDVAAPCQAIVCFPGFQSADQRRCSLLYRHCGSRESRDSATQVNLVAVILMDYQRKQPAPVHALKTERRAITGGSK